MDIMHIKKYKTLADLKAAYDSGELSQDELLVLDNDDTHVYTYRYGEFLAGVPVGHQVFSKHPADVLREALDLLGIPWDEA